MNDVQLVPVDEQDDHDGRSILRFQTGCRIHDLLRIAPESTYTFVRGECEHVGVGGFYLHWGINLGWAFQMYGPGGLSVLSLDAVLANGSLVHFDVDQHPEYMRALTRAGSSLAVVTKIDLTVYHRPSPKSWVVPIHNPFWTVADIEDLYEFVCRSKTRQSEFVINIWVQTNGAFGWRPSFQVTYIGDDTAALSDGGFQKCIDYLAANGFKVDIVDQWIARIYGLVLSDYGLGYHAVSIKLFSSERVRLSYWQTQPYVTSNFIANQTAGKQLMRSYLETAHSHKDAHCLLLINVLQFPAHLSALNPYPWDTVTALDFTCFGGDRHFANEMTAELMATSPSYEYWKYYNIPTREEMKSKYWPDYDFLLRVKQELDASNVFDVFQGIHE